MANVLVLIELRHGAVLPVSLEALGQARRIASKLGASLYALVPLPQAPAYGENDVVAIAGRHGADKVLLMTDDALLVESEMRFATHGASVMAACEQLPPALLIMGATPGARDLAPRVAARLGASFLPEAFMDAEAGALVLADATGAPATPDEPLDRPVVITVPPGRYVSSLGEADTEMIIVSGQAPIAAFTEVGTVALPGTLITGDSPTAEALRQGYAGHSRHPVLILTTDANHTAAPGAVRVCLGGCFATEAPPAVPCDAHYVLTSTSAADLTLLAAALSEAVDLTAADATIEGL